MKPLLVLLMVPLLLATLWMPPPAEARSPALWGMQAATRGYTRAQRPRYRFRKAPRRYSVTRKKAPPRPARTPEPAGGPVYQGDLFVTAQGSPLLSRPATGSQVLARLPKRTVVTNMGRVAVRAGRGTAYYYKVEAPNGKVGYLAVRYLAADPPDW